MEKKSNWKCLNCGNINNPKTSHCLSCGRFESKTAIFRLSFTIFSVIAVLGVVYFWIYFLSNTNSTKDLGKFFVLIFFSMLPIILISTTVYNFIKCYLKTLDLRKNPNLIIHTDPLKRGEAIANSISNNFSEIFEKESNKDVKLTILKKITDQNELFSIIKKEKNEEVKLEGINYLYNEQYLKDLVLNDSSILVKKEALKKILSERDVVEIVLTPAIPNEIKKEGLKRVKKDNFLIRIAKDNLHNELGTLALAKIDNQEIVETLRKELPKKNIEDYISKFSINISRDMFEDWVENELKAFQNHQWFSEALELLLKKIDSFNKDFLKIEKLLVIFRFITVELFDNDQIEISKKIVKENQWEFNRHYEQKKIFFKDYSKLSQQLIHSLYKGGSI
ncbi:hypothetical protein JXR93_06495 [bacterium]|nr:hypothetical protein [bacterium]